MSRARPIEFPQEVAGTYIRARRLAWITLAYVASAAVLLYLTMGGSQAMRASFFEDVISTVPAIAFLIGTGIARSRPNRDYPWGKHRATSIAHLTAALALCAMGLFLLYEAATLVLGGGKPTIGGITLFGHTFWAGWAMLAVLVYTSVPSVILGHRKAKLAPKLHDKVLYADAKMMKADWMAECATAVGVIGAGFGLWWLDPLAAALVSLDILHDGVVNLRVAVADLIDRQPQNVAGDAPDPVPDQVRARLLALDWVEDAEVRMRDEGHVFLGEAYVVPRPGTGELVARIAEAVEAGRAVHWRVQGLTVQPVAELPGYG